MRPKYLGLFLFTLILSCQKQREVPLFLKITATHSGIDFQNNLIENEDFTILDYLYFYNGGGVSAGDINNDGLCDLFFVSNQGKNKLYLNQGVKDGTPLFKDISQEAGIEGYSDWQTGSTMADVNADGFLDIYVCAVGNYKGLNGSNELYMNNGDGTFTEKSHEYGLDFSGFSTQAAFFDYDKDGDLDCYLLNHAVHNTRSYDRVNTRTLQDNEAGDYIYENRDGKFVDISKEAGIYQAAMGYGLGLTVADLNNDGWKDIYVSNDFHEDDYYYINQKDGTFHEEMKDHFKHLSRYSMGSDAADINNDGLLDLMTLDMYPEDEKIEKSSIGEDPLDIYLYKLKYGYFNQYSRNCLQLNIGGEKFSDIAAMSGVAATDWSWSTLMADFDLDGQKDIFVSNGILKRPNDLDYLKFISLDSLHYNVPTSKQLDQKAISLMPDGKWHNYLFKGKESLQFEDKSQVWGFEEKGISNGAAYADLDNDGDLDLITNNLNEAAGIYLNQAEKVNPQHFLKIKLKGNNKNTFGVGAKVIIHADSLWQTLEMMPTRGFLSSVEPLLNFGLGQHQKIDSLLVIWEDKGSQIIYNPNINALLELDQNQANDQVVSWEKKKNNKKIFKDESEQFPLDFTHQENQYFDFNRELLIPFKVSIDGPKIAVGDINGDGLDDIFACGAKYQSGNIFLQTQKGFVQSPQNALKLDSLSEDVDALFFDADNDNDLDLYVVSGGNEFFEQMPQLLDRLYLNDGKGNFTKSTGLLPPMFDNKACVRPCDFDQDGDIDLFVGGRVVAYQYGATPNSYLLENNGHGKFTDVSSQKAPNLKQAGMITDALWADLNTDGYPDLVVAGDWTAIKTFMNKKGILTETKNGIDELSGFWNGLSAEDFDQDGDIDLVAGNLGLNTKFNKEKDGKLRMYFGDMDESGTNEHIVAYNRGSDWYPVNSLSELGKQMPGLFNKKYTNYKDFAGQNLEQIFDSGQLKKATMKEINTFKSLYLENDGTGHFKANCLPSLAQVSKVMVTRVLDANKDGLMDVLLAGNFYGSSMYQARYDASYGLILINKGKGKFDPLLPTESGMLLDGEVRDLKPVEIAGKPFWLSAFNNEKIKFFELISQK